MGITANRRVRRGKLVRLADRKFEDGEALRLAHVLKPRVGRLTVTVTPRQAWVEVDRKRLTEATPVRLEDLPAGTINPNRWERKSQTGLGCTTCWETYGNGWGIGTGNIQAEQSRTPQVPARARPTSLGAAAGATFPGIAGHQFVAVSRREHVSATWAFAC